MYASAREEGQSLASSPRGVLPLRTPTSVDGSAAVVLVMAAIPSGEHRDLRFARGDLVGVVIALIARAFVASRSVYSCSQFTIFGRTHEQSPSSAGYFAAWRSGERGLANINPNEIDY